MLMLVGLALAAPAEEQFCVGEGPDYYAFPLTTTKNIPGTGLATGTAEISVAGASPFSVALTSDGSYEYRVRVALDRMRAPHAGRLVAWVATPELDRVVSLGPLDANLRGEGSVSWNKFIVLVTLEAADGPSPARWTGPVAFRGMSRSGAMHTMVGHGPFQQENCASYGYGG